MDVRRLRKPRPGIYEGVPYRVYESWPYIRSSHLGAACRSALHYRHLLDSADRRETKSQRFGRLLHCVMAGELEDIEVIDGVTWMDLTNRYQRPIGTREWDYRVAKIRREHPGAEVVTPVEMQRAEACRDAVHNCPRALDYLSGRLELSIVWRDRPTGLMCQARLDCVNDGICDLKSTQDASEFDNEVRWWNYHRQLAWYRRGWAVLNKGELLETRIVAVESGPPHGVRAAPLSDRIIEAGDDAGSLALDRIYAGEAGGWPGYNHPQSWDFKPYDAVTLIVDGGERSW